jgi:iron complex transport system permease protein
MKKNGQITRAPNYRLRFLLLAAAIVLVFFISFMLGRYPVGPAEFVKIILSGPPDIGKTLPDAAMTVVWNVRLPRVLAAGLIGAALSAAGASYQGMFRNPMVSPDILGASSGAGFGAALALLLTFRYFFVSLSAFIFGIAAVALAYAISRRSRRSAVLAMVLAGMVVASLFSAATSFIKLIADTNEVLPAITYWLMGSLASIRANDTLMLAVPVIPCLIVLFLLRWRINLLTVGEDEARSIGVDTTRLRAVTILCATLLTASSVAVSGMIGWVGLVIPHFCRMLFGHDYRRLIPASMLLGAVFLIAVDDVARIVTTSEVPIGILTAFLGAPVFIWLFLKGDTDGET